MDARIVRRSVLTMLLVVTCVAACDPAGASDEAPRPTVPTGNVADRLVRIAVAATGVQPPYEVLEIRQGPVDELTGLSPEAEAAASIPPYATGRRSLIRQAWRVRFIGSSCSGDPCEGGKVLVETIIDAQDERVISVRTSPVLPGSPSPSAWRPVSPRA
jgi:hypothetical protein